LLAERARLSAEVESLKAAAAAEAVTSKAELGAQRDKLDAHAADLAARAEALAAGGFMSVFTFHRTADVCVKERLAAVCGC
jgi:hypothetical protein